MPGIDVIVQPSLTFAFSPAKGYTGLVTGRPLVLIPARGGVYQTGNPSETFAFQEPYLRALFGFIGFSDIRTLCIPRTLTFIVTVHRPLLVLPGRLSFGDVASIVAFRSAKVAQLSRSERRR